MAGQEDIQESRLVLTHGRAGRYPRVKTSIKFQSSRSFVKSTWKGHIIIMISNSIGNDNVNDKDVCESLFDNTVFFSNFLFKLFYFI